MLLEAFDSNWIAPVGPELPAFEREVAARVGVEHAVAVTSATAALHLALLLLEVGPGDQVVVPSFTFMASAAAATYLGATPVFVDSTVDNWTMDPALVAEALEATPRRGRPPVAVVAVDLYGQAADFDRLLPICEAAGVPLVDDSAEALGATYRGSPVGSYGEAAVFSFNGNKIITTSGGGMLVSRSEELVARARHLATQAREPVVHYEHVTIGFNYRLSNLLAALGRAQLAGLDRRIARRRAINDAYRTALGELEGIHFMPVADYGEPNWWLTCILIDPDRFGADREQVRLELERGDIEARPTWKPLHLQPVFAEARVLGGANGETVFDRGLCLPSGSSLTDAEQERVVAAIRAVPAKVRGQRR